MRILFLVDNLAIGGAGRVVSRLSTAISEQGHSVCVATTASKEVAYGLGEKVKFYPLSDGKEKASMSVRQRVLTIRQLCIKEQIDVVISFLTELSIYAIMSKIGHAHWKVISCERNDPNIDPKDKRVRALRRILYPFSDGFVFQTEDAKQYFPREIQKKGIVIMNPMASNLPEPYTGERRKAIVAVGRLVEQKNYPTLLRAFAIVSKHFQEYVLEIYGEGPLKGELVDLSKALGIHNRIEFMGQRTDVLLRMRDASLFVLSSDYEGMSNALMEAMALGVPVISTDHPIGGARALITNEENGILVPVNDDIHLAQGMIKLLNNPEKCITLGENAQSVKEKLRLEKIAVSWTDFAAAVVG